MPDFRLRIWAEQVLFDCRDYIVEADTLEAAASLLWAAQKLADEGSVEVDDVRIRSAEEYCLDDMRALDPDEIVSGDTGLTLIDEKGERVRDLVSIPTGCPQLGEPLEFDTEAEYVAEVEEPDTTVVTERDDDEAILPDGTRCNWDERLRTIGAVRVPREAE